MNRKTGPITITLGLLGLLALLFTGLWATERLPSSLREWLFLQTANLITPEEREPGDLNFYVLGHIYGSPSIPDGLPAASLLNRLPEIINTQPDFIVSLGDVVYRKTETDFDNLRSSLLDQLTFPLYNTPGNHDVTNHREIYESYFGKQTYFGLQRGPAELIFLDTERVECSLDQPQLDLLRSELDKALSDPQTRYIFVFMHKTLVFQNPGMKALKNKQAMPNVWDCQKKDGANPLMETYFIPAARHKPVIIFAGDVGAWGNLSPYYQRDPWLPLTLVMTGLGDSPQDNLIRVHVSPTSLKMDALFLADMSVVPLQTYNEAHWLNIARGR